ncbi:MAG: CpsD/CapB family tyrosine-protein kinase [Phycisphaerae bacterium]
MGRTAEALERAERKRNGDARRMRITASDQMRKWSHWYGAAQSAPPSAERGPAEQIRSATPVPGMSEQIVSYYNSTSIRSEQYRSLRTRLLSANQRQAACVYAVSSALPGEGKSITVANLGFSFAEIPHLNVLMVDGDFRRAKLAKLLNIDSNPGLADFLQGLVAFEDIIRSTPVPNLFFVPAGKTHGRSATELLSRKAARTAFQRFAREYDHTIVDTPPAATVADVGIIGQLTTGVIFVVRMHRTPEPLAKRAIRRILNNNVPIIGGLLIGEHDPAGGYGRKYSSDRYYKYERNAAEPGQESTVG